ncbi:3'-5' exonuclease [Kocuria turfanensis]|uniref:3'-5' exonuclease n=1 Tax=Kocuria turfanensis TaxID=388357 RepID=A0A512I8G7_9MICC|nr:3'-5' exonuclease [Kocuria turfanensis]GEO93971.1 3'-5' exonuclease [Kocuria turfanensis]
MSSPSRPAEPTDQPPLFDAAPLRAAPPAPSAAGADAEQDVLFELGPPTVAPGAAPAWTEGPRAAFDLETTGRDPHTARIVTASVVRTDASGTVTDEWEWLADPGVEIPEEAAAVHGVSTERARAEGRPAAEVVAQIARVLAELFAAGTPVLVFNASYDFTVLAHEGRRHGVEVPQPFPVLDPYVLNKQVHRYRRGKRTLGALCEEYGVELTAAHTSAADAVATERLAVLMARRFPELVRPAAELHEDQVGWAAEQAASLQEYFRRTRPDAVVDGAWPLRRPEDA